MGAAYHTLHHTKYTDNYGGSPALASRIPMKEDCAAYSPFPTRRLVERCRPILYVFRLGARHPVEARRGHGLKERDAEARGC